MGGKGAFASAAVDHFSLPGETAFVFGVTYLPVGYFGIQGMGLSAWVEVGKSF